MCFCHRTIVGAGNRDRHGFLCGAAIAVIHGIRERHIAGFIDAQVLEAVARLKCVRPICVDRHGTFGRSIHQRIRQIVAVDITGRQLTGHSAAVFDRVKCAGFSNRTIVGTGHGDRHGFLCGAAVAVIDRVRERHIAGFIDAQVLEAFARLKAV